MHGVYSGTSSPNLSFRSNERLDSLEDIWGNILGHVRTNFIFISILKLVGISTINYNEMSYLEVIN